MIEKVDVRSFRNITSQNVELKPLTVFVGANGTGKTSFLESIYIATRCLTDAPKEIFKGDFHPRYLANRHRLDETEVECLSMGGRFGFKLSYGNSIISPDMSEFQDDDKNWSVEVSPEDEVSKKEQIAKQTPAALLRLDARKLASSSFVNETSPVIESDGTGLATTLAAIKLDDPDCFEVIETLMREMIPQLKRLRIKKVELTRRETEFFTVDEKTYNREVDRQVVGEQLLFDFVNARGIPANRVSEGTLILLGLIAVLHQPSTPQILLIDDLAQALHPNAQRQLIGVLRDVMKSFTGLQMIATTHSPYLVDSLLPDEVRLVTLDDEGGSVFGSLTDHPEFEKWKSEMAPGEMWSMFGERWVADRKVK